MKYLIVLNILFALACSSKSENKDTIKAFIPGTYVKQIKSEFSSGSDTIKITTVSNEGNNYRIVRQSSYRRKVNGKPLPKERKSTIRIALYKPAEKVLYETVNGNILSFNPVDKVLYLNSSKYSKVSQ